MFSLEQNTYKNARLGDTDFTDAELRGYTFENCDLRGAMFSGALLEKCRFSACAFDFSRLNDVLARGCSFENCTFSGASLFVTAFENCRVSGCSFAGADLTGWAVRGGTLELCARSLSAQKAGLFRHQPARYELCGSGPRKSRSFRLRPYGDRVPQYAAERMRPAPCQIFAHRYPLCKNAENKDRFGGRGVSRRAARRRRQLKNRQKIS